MVVWSDPKFIYYEIIDEGDDATLLGYCWSLTITAIPASVPLSGQFNVSVNVLRHAFMGAWNPTTGTLDIAYCLPGVATSVLVNIVISNPTTGTVMGSGTTDGSGNATILCTIPSTSVAGTKTVYAVLPNASCFDPTACASCSTDFGGCT